MKAWSDIMNNISWKLKFKGCRTSIQREENEQYTWDLRNIVRINLFLKSPLDMNVTAKIGVFKREGQTVLVIIKWYHTGS